MYRRVMAADVDVVVLTAVCTSNSALRPQNLVNPRPSCSGRREETGIDRELEGPRRVLGVRSWTAVRKGTSDGFAVWITRRTEFHTEPLGCLGPLRCDEIDGSRGGSRWGLELAYDLPSVAVGYNGCVDELRARYLSTWRHDYR